MLKDCRLILHHSLVTNVEKHHKSMFRRGGKIIIHVIPKPRNSNAGPVSNSPFNYFRLVFRNGGEDEVYFFFSSLFLSLIANLGKKFVFFA